MKDRSFARTSDTSGRPLVYVIATTDDMVYADAELALRSSSEGGRLIAWPGGETIGGSRQLARHRSRCSPVHFRRQTTARKDPCRESADR